MPYAAFIVPGMIMLSMFTESIFNASFGIYMPKWSGTIYELLSAPVSSIETVIAYVGAAATKSIAIGLVIFATAHLFIDIQIAHLRKQLEQTGLSLDISERALNQIASEGYDPTFGARPLKRVIQQRVVNPLSRELLKGEFPEGSVVHIDFVDDGFTFARSDEPARESITS